MLASRLKIGGEAIHPPIACDPKIKILVASRIFHTKLKECEYGRSETRARNNSIRRVLKNRRKERKVETRKRSWSNQSIYHNNLMCLTNETFIRIINTN